VELVDFLRARLNEDERIARDAGGRSEQAWEADLSGKDPLGMPSWPAVVRYLTGGRLRGAVAHLPVMQERSEDRMVHIARHDPARILAEVEAKRSLLDRYETQHWHGPAAPTSPDPRDHVEDTGACRTCVTARTLARVYRNHPDFNPAWLED